MFGFLYTLICCGAIIGDKISYKIKDNECKKNWTDEDGVYLDPKGRRIHAKTGAILTPSINSNKELVYYYKGEPAINATESYYRREYEKAKKEGIQTDVKVGLDKHENDLVKGVRFRDTKTGQIYVKREVEGVTWYMNLNGEFVKPTYGQINHRKKWYFEHEYKLGKYATEKEYMDKCFEEWNKKKEYLNKKQKSEEGQMEKIHDPDFFYYNYNKINF